MKNYKANKNEKKEIKNIINEIDTIMFGGPMNLKFNKFNGLNLAEGLLGAVVGMGIASFLEDIKARAISIGVGYVVGTIISCYSQNETHYYEYENAYLKLSRKNQIKVLELSKKLVEMLKADISFDKNRKHVEKYLDFDNENTMFNNFENNHPHFEILSQEKTDEIHKKGMLTPEEAYNDWISSICAPGDGGGSAAWRCEKYGNCRDCLVAYAMECEEWSPLEFKYTNVLDRDIDYDCDTNSEVKRKVKE